jgi:hypothetical protein
MSEDEGRTDAMLWGAWALRYRWDPDRPPEQTYFVTSAPSFHSVFYKKTEPENAVPCLSIRAIDVHLRRHSVVMREQWAECLGGEAAKATATKILERAGALEPTDNGREYMTPAGWRSIDPQGLVRGPGGIDFERTKTHGRQGTWLRVSWAR